MRKKVPIALLLLSSLSLLACKPPPQPPLEPDWELVWEDNFNSFNTNVWSRQSFHQAGELQDYDTTDVHSYVADGKLVIKAIYNNTGTYNQAGDYTSARVISNPGGADGASGNAGKTFKYGRIVARIKLPYGKGVWPAFWMLGDNISETGGSTAWPACGEIDIVETGCQYHDDGYYGHATSDHTIHYADASSTYRYTGGNDRLSSGKFADSYHTFEIQWNDEEIIWFVDGDETHSEDITGSAKDEFRKYFYVIFNVAVGGPGYPYTPDGTATFPQYMYVDWIRYYEDQNS